MNKNQNGVCNERYSNLAFLAANSDFYLEVVRRCVAAAVVT